MSFNQSHKYNKPKRQCNLRKSGVLDFKQGNNEMLSDVYMRQTNVVSSPVVYNHSLPNRKLYKCRKNHQTNMKKQHKNAEVENLSYSCHQKSSAANLDENEHLFKVFKLLQSKSPYHEASKNTKRSNHSQQRHVRNNHTSIHCQSPPTSNDKLPFPHHDGYKSFSRINYQQPLSSNHQILQRSLSQDPVMIPKLLLDDNLSEEESNPINSTMRNMVQGNNFLDLDQKPHKLSSDESFEIVSKISYQERETESNIKEKWPENSSSTNPSLCDSKVYAFSNFPSSNTMYSSNKQRREQLVNIENYDHCCHSELDSLPLRICDLDSSSTSAHTSSTTCSSSNENISPTKSIEHEQLLQRNFNRIEVDPNLVSQQLPTSPDISHRSNTHVDNSIFVPVSSYPSTSVVNSTKKRVHFDLTLSQLQHEHDSSISIKLKLPSQPETHHEDEAEPTELPYFTAEPEIENNPNISQQTKQVIKDLMLSDEVLITESPLCEQLVPTETAFGKSSLPKLLEDGVSENSGINNRILKNFLELENQTLDIHKPKTKSYNGERKNTLSEESSSTVIFDVTSEDEEDALHSSLNDLSFDSCHLGSLGTTLRLLRLYRILHNMNENERLDMMRKFRAFSKWHKITRVNRLIHNQELQKWKRAKQHENVQLLMRCFLNWRFYTTSCNAKANALYRKHMQTKGLTALKWLVLKCRERDAWLKKRGNFKTSSRYFYKWIQRLRQNRDTRLRSSFTRWKMHYRHTVMLGILEEQQNQRSLLYYYCYWRKKLQERQTENLAVRFYVINLKKKIMESWRIYIADCDVHRTQNFVARQQFQIKTSMKFFKKWRTLSSKCTRAKLFFHKKVLQHRLRDWTEACDRLKLIHRKQISLSRQLRRKYLIENSWHTWITQLLLTEVVKRRNLRSLRECFVSWKFEFNEKLKLHKSMVKFREKFVLLRALMKWKEYRIEVIARRCKAVVHIHHVVLIHSIRAWSEWMNRIKYERDTITKYRNRKIFAQKRETFMRWKSLFYRIFMERENRRQWSVTCVRKAGSKWIDFVKRKRLYRKLENFRNNQRRILAKSSLTRWKDRLCKERNKQEKADKLFSLFSKRHSTLVLRNWHKYAQDSFIIRPFVEQRSRRKCTKIFDAWRSLVTKMHSCYEFIEKTKKNKLSESYWRWKWEYLKKQRLENFLQDKESNLKRTVLSSLKQFAVRRRNMNQIIVKRNRDTIRSVYLHWACLVAQRHLAAEELVQESIKNHAILYKSFTEWKQYTVCEKMLREDSISWFSKDRKLRVKSATFKRWKKSIVNLRLSKKFNESMLQHQLSAIINAWNQWTQRNIRERWENFSESLKTRQSGAETNSESDGTIQTFSAYSDTDGSSRDISSSCKQFASFIHDFAHQHPIICGESNVELLHGVDHVNNDSGVETNRGFHSEVSSVCSAGLDRFSTSQSHCRDGSFGVLSDEISSTNQPMTSDFNHCSRSDVISSSDDVIACSYEAICSDDNFLHEVSVSDHSLKLNDLVSSDSDVSDSTSTSIDCDVITQREVLSCDKTLLHWNAEPNHMKTFSLDYTSYEKDFHRRSSTSIHEIVLRRPRSAIEVISQESTQSRLERLVRFAVARLSSPSLSQAFYQWKLLSHGSKWDKSMLCCGRKKIERQRIKHYMCEWRVSLKNNQLGCAHYSRNLTRIVTLSWIEWFHRIKKINRMKFKATTKHNHRLYLVHFNKWKNIHQQRSALNEILRYWMSRVADHSCLDEHEMALQSKRNTSLLERCLDVWKARKSQIDKCDLHFQRHVLSRLFDAWLDYARGKAEASNEIALLRNRLMKRRYTSTWRRALITREKAEQLRTRCLRSWLVKLTTRWRTWAHNQYERGVSYEVLVLRLNQRVMKEKFIIWRDKMSIRRMAARSRDRSLKCKAIVFWRNHVIETKMMSQKLEDYKSRSNSSIVKKTFSLWKNMLRIQIIGGDFKLYKKKMMWSQWRSRLLYKRANQLGRRMTLRWYFVSWMNEHEVKRKSLVIARNFLWKWHAITRRNLQHSTKAEEFSSLRITKIFRDVFERWLLVYKHSLEAHEFLYKNTTKRAFQSWRAFSLSKRLHKDATARFLQHQSQNTLLSLWRIWLVKTTRQKEHQSSLNSFEIKRNVCFQLEYFSRWQQKLYVKKAVQHWRHTLVLKIVRSWRRITLNGRNRDFKLQECKVRRNKTIVFSSFMIWLNGLRNLKVAKTHSAKTTRRLILKRWIDTARNISTQRQKYLWFVNKMNRNRLQECMDSWKNRFQVIDEIKFVADEIYFKHQTKTTFRLWIMWKDAVRKKQAKRLRIEKIEAMVIAKWRYFVREKALSKAVSEFQLNTLKRSAFNTWLRQKKVYSFVRKRHHDVIKEAVVGWQQKTAQSTFALAYSNHRSIMKAWTIWRIRRVQTRTDVQSSDEINRHLLNTTFQAWRYLTLEASSTRKSLAYSSRIPRLKRI